MTALATPVRTFGEALHRRRLEKGWTVTRLARVAGIARWTVYRYESDERPPRPVYRLALRMALGLDEHADDGWWRTDW